MTNIDTDTVHHIAKLARLRLDATELPRYTEELASIFAWVEMLGEVPGAPGHAVTSVVDHALPMRADAVTDGNRPAEILANAPHQDYDCFVVPKVVDQG